MNVISKAWAEGKKNAEYDRVEELGNDILTYVKKELGIEDKIEDKEKAKEQAISQQILKWPKGVDKSSTELYYTFGVPACCKRCSNHPMNGGSGTCYCTLPHMTITGSTT